jgi:hypothetical protein
VNEIAKIKMQLWLVAAATLCCATAGYAQTTSLDLLKATNVKQCLAAELPA